MRSTIDKKGLSGVNRKCRQCTEDCNQWEQVTVVYCPRYRAKVAKTEKWGDLHTGQNAIFAF